MVDELIRRKEQEITNLENGLLRLAEELKQKQELYTMNRGALEQMRLDLKYLKTLPQREIK